jgi:hypothetical protein
MKEVIKITRGEIVSHLSQSMMEALVDDVDFLYETLDYGFKGFYNYTDDELLKEYREYISQDPHADIEIQLIGESE